MTKKILFFLRANNDIDHIVPIIYKWLSIEKVPTDIVLTSSPDHMNDYRIRFLRQFENLRVYFIDEFLSKKNRKKQKQKSQIAKRSRYHPARIINKIWNKMSPPSTKTLYDALFVERMFDSVFENVDKGIIVFDWTYTDFVSLVLKAAKKRGFITISLPHGDRPHYNRMNSLNDLDYSCIEAYADGTMFDYMVVPNRLCAERYEPYIEPSDRIKVLGSPRYNDEWLDIIPSLIPTYHSAKSHDKLKIVFFLCNFNYPIFWDEVIRTIKMLLKFSGVYLIVKHHTRSATVQNLINAYPELGENVPNLEIFYDDVPSEALLQWADIVLDLGTSVTFEAVKHNKPVLAMEYLNANHTTVAHYMKTCEIKCRDDLYNWIQRFLQNGTDNFYDETERQRFIREIIDGSDKDVLKRYVKFLKSCF